MTLAKDFTISADATLHCGCGYHVELHEGNGIAMTSVLDLAGKHALECPIKRAARTMKSKDMEAYHELRRLARVAVQSARHGASWYASVEAMIALERHLDTMGAEDL